MAIPFLVQLAIGVGLMILGYMLMPKPKQEKPPSTDDLDEPTAEAGRPIPVIWGSLAISSPNLIGNWDKFSRHRKMRKSRKK